ncbi:MAG: hypothetical protein PHW82_13395, partial [Bacteroidales bacterium]|nr:hypothetical protein [Bacteroidales bacterium]
QKIIIESGLDWSSICLYTPYSGTTLHKKLNAQKRLTHTNYPRDWALYNYTNVLYKPKIMTSQELTDFFINSSITFYSEKNVKKMLLRTIWNLKSLRKTYYLYLWIVNHWQSLKNFKVVKRFFILCQILYK